jgi:hypothetical protein
MFQQFQVPVSADDPMNDYLLQPGESIEDGIEKRGVVQIMERQQPPPWKCAAQRVTEDDWRRFKDEYFEEANKRDKARKGIK